MSATVFGRLVSHLANIRADVNVSTVHRLMVLLRELLEERCARKIYPTLTMYCDWSVHTKLDRSQAGNALLDILDAMWAESKIVDKQFEELVRAISPRTLQDQMATLLVAAHINPTMVLEVESCSKVFQYLVDDLKGKIVVRQNNAIRKKTIERLSNGFRFIAHRFYFEDNESGKNQFVLVAKQIEPPSGGEVLIKMPWHVR